MKVSVVKQPLADVAADAVVVGLHADERKFPPAVAAVDGKLGGQLRAVLDAEKFQSKPGQLTHVHTAGRAPAARLIVVGLGPRRELTAEIVRRSASAALRRARDLGARAVAAQLFGDRVPVRQRAHALVEGAILGTYTFDRYKREKTDKQVDELRVVAESRDARDAEQGARTGEVFASATWLARDLVNAPANDVHPTHLAEVASQVARDGKLKLKVFDRAECEKMGMGAFLGVAAGSDQPPKFIHLTYTPSGRAAKRVAVIGKGITFDAGGLDLKSAEGMLRMKDDMSGAAAVLGIMRALPQLKPAVEVHGLIAATENMPSGSAIRPGDVLRAMNGTTIEIGNTDAEGRLTLADALSYAAKHIEPDEAIDMATLTGACVVALGPLCSGLMANNQPLANRLLAAADLAGERVWQLPLIDEYREQLKSEVADLNNVGQRGGGAITAGLFLREFAGSTPWAHFDIAGAAFTEKDLPLGPKGATGVAVRTILMYLTSDGRRAAGGSARPPAARPSRAQRSRAQRPRAQRPRARR
jgi:leucyl aminopeptidase